MEDKVTERKLVKMLRKNVFFSYSRLDLATHCSSNVIVPGVCVSFVTMPIKNNFNTSPKYLRCFECLHIAYYSVFG